MALASQIDSVINGGRDKVLSALSNTQGSIPLTGVFAAIIVVMIIVMFVNYQKGVEERKKNWGPFFVILFSVFMIFGFSTRIAAWIVMGCCGFFLVRNMLEGEWMGSLGLVAIMFGMSFIVSVNFFSLLFMGVGIGALTFFTKKANTERKYGTPDERHVREEAGFPEAKERKITKVLEKMARGFRWSRDKMANLAGHLKTKIAEREAHNVEEQQHEAGIAAAGEQIARTVEELEQREVSLEQHDNSMIDDIVRDCTRLDSHVASLSGPMTVENQQRIHSDILAASKDILNRCHTLVKDKLEEESAIEKANKVLVSCTDIIHHSAREAKQLKESRSSFTEIKKVSDSMIISMKRELVKSERGVEAAKKAAERSKTAGASERIKLLAQRDCLLRDIDKKLSDIDAYIRKIMAHLNKINLEEDSRIKEIDSLNDKAVKHTKRLEHFAKQLKEEDAGLRKLEKRFAKVFRHEASEIPDEQFEDMIECVLMMFASLRKIAETYHNYTNEELSPLIREMAEAAQNTSHLAATSKYLSKMYYFLSDAASQMTKIGEDLDSRPGGAGKLKKIVDTEELERDITKRAYRKSDVVISHIRDGYKHLENANNHLNNSMNRQKSYDRQLENAQQRVNKSLNDGFDILMKKEVKQAQRARAEAERAEQDLSRARRAERGAQARI